MANGNGLHVPRWALVAGGLLITVISGTISATLAVSQVLGDATKDKQVTQLRLCRIERALAIEPWPTCPAVVKP